MSITVTAAARVPNRNNKIIVALVRSGSRVSHHTRGMGFPSKEVEAKERRGGRTRRGGYATEYDFCVTNWYNFVNVKAAWCGVCTSLETLTCFSLSATKNGAIQAYMAAIAIERIAIQSRWLPLPWHPDGCDRASPPPPAQVQKVWNLHKSCCQEDHWEGHYQRLSCGVVCSMVCLFFSQKMP